MHLMLCQYVKIILLSNITPGSAWVRLTLLHIIIVVFLVDGPYLFANLHFKNRVARHIIWPKIRKLFLTIGETRNKLVYCNMPIQLWVCDMHSLEINMADMFKITPISTSTVAGQDGGMKVPLTYLSYQFRN